MPHAGDNTELATEPNCDVYWDRESQFRQHFRLQLQGGDSDCVWKPVRRPRRQPVLRLGGPGWTLTKKCPQQQVYSPRFTPDRTLHHFRATKFVD